MLLLAQTFRTTPSVPWFIYALNAVVLLLSIFLILLVLIQRGKGGGLAGAFGGVGGSSAFGSRAGDLFTRITIGVAAAWIILTMIEVVVIQNSEPAQQAKKELKKDT
jgi:preprotein translocase subunit SecG